MNKSNRIWIAFSYICVRRESRLIGGRNFKHLTVRQFQVCNAENGLTELAECQIPVPFLPPKNWMRKKSKQFWSARSPRCWRLFLIVAVNKHGRHPLRMHETTWAAHGVVKRMCNSPAGSWRDRAILRADTGRRTRRYQFLPEYRMSCMRVVSVERSQNEFCDDSSSRVGIHTVWFCSEHIFLKTWKNDYI